MLSYLGPRAELPLVSRPVPFGEVQTRRWVPFPSEQVAAPDPCSWLGLEGMRKWPISQSLSPRHCPGLKHPAHSSSAGGRQGQTVSLSPKMPIPTSCLLMGKQALSPVVPRQDSFIPKSVCVLAMARGEKAAFVRPSLAGKPSQAPLCTLTPGEQKP